ncbi:uncharacterized protein TNCV_4532221 [Trichonephila clavipes]|nr:uncharacterized protein TNCV_4532221 [Trichonephila clavipes]
MHLELHQNKIEFIYHSVTKKVKIKLGDQARVVLYKGLAELLGFEPGEYKKSVESPYIADPTASFPIIYAYCDLVEPQIVGHTQAPLLKNYKSRRERRRSSQCSLYKTSLRTCYSTTVPND